MPSLVLLKPDCMDRGLLPEAFGCLRSFQVVAMRMTAFSELMFHAHYKEHAGKPFYPELADAMIGADVVAIELAGDILEIREAAMKFRSRHLQADYVGPRNLIHSSDSEESAAREIKLWFSQEENGLSVEANEPPNLPQPEPLLKWFNYEHLPEHLKVVSIKFYELACSLCALVERGPERTVALRKLLEAKDAGVRAAIEVNS